MEEENIKTEQHTSSEKKTLVEKGLPHKNKQSSLNSNIFPIIPVDLREIPSQLASTLPLRLPPKSQSRNGGVLTVTLSALLLQFHDEQACQAAMT